MSCIKLHQGSENDDWSTQLAMEQLVDSEEDRNQTNSFKRKGAEVYQKQAKT